jgi:hypothetical protein
MNKVEPTNSVKVYTSQVLFLLISVYSRRLSSTRQILLNDTVAAALMIFFSDNLRPYKEAEESSEKQSL